MNFLRRTLCLALAATLLGAASVVLAATTPQSRVASRTARFAEISKTDPAYTSAFDARNLDLAKKLINQDAHVRGTVNRLFVPEGDGVVVLNLAAEFRTAVSAVVYKEHWAAFPNLDQLVDREVVLSGKMTDFRGRPQLLLRTADQIKLVKPGK